MRFVLVLLCSTQCYFYFCNYLDGAEGTGCFSLIVFLMSYGCYCSVVLTRSGLGLSAGWE